MRVLENKMASTSVVPSCDEKSESMKLLTRFVTVCSNEILTRKYMYPVDDYVKRAEVYTGLSKDTLRRLFYENVKVSNLEDIDRSIIHKALCNFYINQGIVPSTHELFASLTKELPIYMDIRMFRKLLVKMGYMWKLLPSLKMGIIERPSITFERHLYLKNIIYYRQQGIPIYFLEENIFNKYCTKDITKKYAFFHSTENEEIQKQNPCSHIVYAVSTTGIYFLKFGEKNILEEWVNEFAPDRRSVIVLRNTRHNMKEIVKLPTYNSLRIDMLDWLEYHDVPHAKEMSKLELYELITKYTNVNEKIYRYDSMLKNKGHIVLRLPECLNQLTPSYLVHKCIQENILPMKRSDWNHYINQLFASIDLDTIESYCNLVAVEEKSIFEDHIKLDTVLDILCTRMDIKPLNDDSDYPSDSD